MNNMTLKCFIYGLLLRTVRLCWVRACSQIFPDKKGVSFYRGYRTGYYYRFFTNLDEMDYDDGCAQYKQQKIIFHKKNDCLFTYFKFELVDANASYLTSRV